MNTMIYRDIPNGKLFRLLEAERIGEHDIIDEGIFVKIGNSHAVRVQAGLSNKTIIPGPKVKCHVLPGKHDTSFLPDWSMVNRPYTD